MQPTGSALRTGAGPIVLIHGVKTGPASPVGWGGQRRGKHRTRSRLRLAEQVPAHSGRRAVLRLYNN
jgi:hypothetical protein